jgi:molybdopterin-binding protein
MGAMITSVLEHESIDVLKSNVGNEAKGWLHRPTDIAG